MTTTAIGFIGVGRMGGAVARRLSRGGFDVRVFDPDDRAVERCSQAGATAAASAVDAVTGADIAFTSLPMPEHVVATWRQIAAHMPATAIGVDLSTIDPATARSVSKLMAERGVPFISCTLGNTPAAAEEGRIPLFIGGPEEAVAALGPIWERMGEKIYDFATPEAATMFKLISNLVGMTNVAVLAEGYVLARRAGIAPEIFAEALADTGARSFQSDVRLPWLVEGDFEARFGAALAAKDVRLAMDAAARWGVPTPVGAQGLSQLVSAVAHGHGDEDVIAMAKVLDPDGSLLSSASEGSEPDG